jgi:hypothetical protein
LFILVEHCAGIAARNGSMPGLFKSVRLPGVFGGRSPGFRFPLHPAASPGALGGAAVGVRPPAALPFGNKS